MTTPKPLTPYQRAALDYIIDHKTAHDGIGPSIREIMRATPYTSTSAVLYALRVLERYGYIERPEDGAPRNIQVNGGRWAYEQPVEQEVT